MGLTYNVIEIFTSEEVRCDGRPLYSAVAEYVKSKKIAARCIVSRGIAGCFENGEIASSSISLLSMNMPLKIEIILPAAELEVVLKVIEKMVVDGIVVVKDMDVRSHRTRKRLIPRQLRVKDVMTVSPVSVTPKETAEKIISILISSSFDSLIVRDDRNRPVGIITEKDLIAHAGMPVRIGLLSRLDRKKVDEYLKKAGSTQAEKIMTSPVTTVSEESSLGHAVDIMLKKHLKRLPVVDDKGRLTGILARFDVLHTISHETPRWKKMKGQKIRVDDIKSVGDILNRDIETIGPEMAVEKVIRLFSRGNFQRVAVVDNEDRLLGIISDSDLIGIFAEHQAGVWDFLVSKLPFHEMAERHRELIRKTKGTIAGDVMRKELITVQEETCIDDAIRIMTEKGIKRLPVVDDKGVFKGMISRESLIKTGHIE